MRDDDRADAGFDPEDASRPQPLARSARYRLRREEVIDAAATVFAERGYHGASTKLIADRVGIKQGSLYYYFPSKESALEEVCLKGVGDFIDGLAGIIGSDLPVEGKLRAAVLNHLTPLVERPAYVRTFVNQRQFLPDASRRSVGQQARQYEAMLTELIRSGVAEGAFAPDLDCELAALGLIGECNWVFVWHGRRALGRSIEAIADDMAKRFLMGVKRQ